MAYSTKLMLGDCLDSMKELYNNSVDTIITDPPYGICFMGKKWDYDIPSVEIWREVLRVLKPGGHLLSFGGTRTYHRMVVNIEDAGFEIRDQIQWLYASGFPKSLSISKGIDKKFGAEREVVGKNPNGVGRKTSNTNRLAGLSQSGIKGKSYDENSFITSPSTDLAKQWDGFGTALKPANEIIVIAQKPLDETQKLAILARDLLLKIGAILCQSKSFAQDVKKNLKQNQAISKDENIAQWIVGKSTLTLANLLEVMDIEPSKSMVSSNLSIVLSWRAILSVVLNQMNMCTIETESSLTTDLKILSCLPWENMQASIIQGSKKIVGQDTNVKLAENIFSVVSMKLNCTQTLSAIDNAILEAANPVLHPNSNPIVLARKPLSEKTIVDNVLRWGTGGLNIDGCRISAKGYTSGGQNNSIAFGQDLKKQPRCDGSQGRFPANLILGHNPDCELVGEKKVKAITGGTGAASKKTSGLHNFKPTNSGSKGDKDGTETVADWKCTDGCAVKMLDEQSGVTSSRVCKKIRPKQEKSNSKIKFNGKAIAKPNINTHADSGGAARFFQNIDTSDIATRFKYTAKASKRERNAGLDNTDLIWETEIWEKEGLNSLVEDINRLSKGTSGDILTVNKRWSTGLYGRSISDQYPKGMIYTIKTTIKLITELKTLKPSQNSNTKDIIQDAIKMIEANGLSLAESVKFINQLNLNTMKEKAGLALGAVNVVLTMLLKIKNFANSGNFHSTVKPLKLMEYLCKLITPPNGTVLDPFMGSGTTGIACKNLGFGFIGIEKNKEYFDIAKKRIQKAKK